MSSRACSFALAAFLTVACTAPDGGRTSQGAARPIPVPPEPNAPAAPDSWIVLERVRDAIRDDLRAGEVVRARSRAASVLGVIRILPSDPRARILEDIERLDSFAASLSARPAPVR